ncbi:MAG: DUF5711 family protein [Blautia wexlerae]
MWKREAITLIKVVQTSEQEDIVSTNYVEMDGNILRYSPDGVSLVSDKMSTLLERNLSDAESCGRC